MTEFQLNAAEKRLLERSADLNVTRRRIRSVVIFASAFVAIILYWIISGRPPGLLNWIFPLYVLITAYEKIMFGISVLAYKRLIQKLGARLASIEGFQLN